MIRCPKCDSDCTSYQGGYHEKLVYTCVDCGSTFTINTDQLQEDEDE